MLSELSVADVRRVAELADAARSARDAALKIKPKDDLGEPPPVRGQHDATAPLGFEPLPADHSRLRAFREAIAALSDEGLYELRALSWIGRGEHAAKDWDKAIAAAESESRDTNVGNLQDDVDLHHVLMKALFELELA